MNKNKPAPFNALTEGINYMGIANILRGRPEGVEFMETVLTELEERVAHGVGAVPDERFRLLLVGTACYTNFRDFVGMFERWDGVFVACGWRARSRTQLRPISPDRESCRADPHHCSAKHERDLLLP